MDPASFNKELRSIADIITADETHYGNVFLAAQRLHALFVSAGALDSNDQEYSGTGSDTGYAVSPSEAGRCVFDLARTIKFSRGFKKAIQDRLNYQNKKPVEILYAGTGPYATLAMLVIPYFAPEDIQFTLIDIHEESVVSVNKLIDTFGLQKYICSIHCADATIFVPSDNAAFDILLTETMQQALRKEQQVSIAAHLVQFLKEDGVMIPQRIEVKPVFTETNIRQAIMVGEDVSKFSDRASFEYASVALLDLHSAKQIRSAITKPFREMSFPLNPDFLKRNYVLELITTINVCEGEVLASNESAITLPYHVKAGNELAGETQITFTYKNDSMPGFVWQTS